MCNEVIEGSSTIDFKRFDCWDFHEKTQWIISLSGSLVYACVLWYFSYMSRFDVVMTKLMPCYAWSRYLAAQHLKE